MKLVSYILDAVRCIAHPLPEVETQNLASLTLPLKGKVGVKKGCAVLRHFLDVSLSPSVKGGFNEASESDYGRALNDGLHSSYGPVNNSLPFKGRARVGMGYAIKTFLFTLMFAASAFGADYVVNTAKGTYSLGPMPGTSTSNTVSNLICTASSLEFLKYAPLSSEADKVIIHETKYVDHSGSYVSKSPPIPAGSSTPIDLANPVPLVSSNVFHAGEAIFLSLSDDDQNVDPAVEETVVLKMESSKSGENETLLLSETGPDTGVFTGYIQSVTDPVAAKDGLFTVSEDDDIVASYEDKCGQSDTSAFTIVAAAALVDPFGIVFDTSNGNPVDGATVTLVDVNSGQPATVYGDDGVSSYPASVTTGGTASDSSGASYSFPPGGFRFPFISPGRYRLDVVPPAAYRDPSNVADEDIQNLPGAPFALVNPGSRGEDFYINPGPAINIDIPVDPIFSLLYVTKEASKSSASAGDFIQYLVGVENTSTQYDINSVVVSDRLPVGFRYKKGSARIDDVATADPVISEDGRTLSFTVGALAAGASVDITYVAEVAAGVVAGKKAKNIASATGVTVLSGAPVVSNTATAIVQITEDLFGSKSIIMGRVFAGCGGAEGVEGVRIYLEDGTYSVTDKKGMYHFEGLNAGTHAVQLDLETVPERYELVSCEDNDRFAGTPFSQFVDIQGGTMWRADFHFAEKPKPVEPEIRGMVGIELNSVLLKEEVEYEVSLYTEEVPVENMRLTLILPEGTAYKPGSSVLGDSNISDPNLMGDVLTYRLGGAGERWKGTIKLKALVPLDGKNGDLVAKALLTFDSLGKANRRTPLVDNILKRNLIEERSPNPDIILRPHFEEFGTELTKEDREMLDRIIEDLKKKSVRHMVVTGHTNTTRINPRSRHIHADNYALSLARAKAVGPYIAEGLGLSPDQITMEGKGPDEPIASNKTANGRALNRRVELRIVSETAIRTTELDNIKDRSGVRDVEVTGVKPKEISAVEKEKEERSNAKTMPEFGNTWLDEAEPGLAFVWPYEGFHPPIPSVKMAVKHDPGKKLKLLLNGEEVDPLYLDGTKKRIDNKVAVSQWIGVSLQEGDNLFEAVEYGDSGNVESRMGRTIHYSSPPVKLVLVPEKSRLTADGQNPSVIAVRLIDKDGHPAREGVVGEYTIDPPYLPFQLSEELQNEPLSMSKSDILKYLVGEDGIVLISLQPTSKTGEAVVRFNLMNGEQEVKAWLAPGERDWVLVGLAEGTAGYNIANGNMESLDGSEVDDKYYQDGRVAFFAKGMIKGKWLLTAAYDTDKNGNPEDNDSLHSVIDPDKYYTLYGDATQQGYEAASARSLYLKIERDKFYALFGDYETGLNVTELSRYSRNLNGLKSEMKGDKFDFKVFASDTNQAFVKDEIRGDGTSGLYTLSRKNIVINSESIVIETRDRFQSEVIISSQSMTRHLDYSIDYDSGTIYFKSPIYSQDDDFNPIYIVVNYESFDATDTSFNYGGRGAVRFFENSVEVGATHIHEGSVGGEGNLEGMDATVKITEKTTVKTEFAATSVDSKGSGKAYITELVHKSDKLDGNVYVREQEERFGLGQQNGSESGTRKLGFGGSYRLNEKISLKSEAYRQYNLSTDALRDLAEAQIQYSEKSYELSAGLRHAEDTLGDGSVETSDQITTGGSFRLMDNKLTVSLQHDQSLMRSNGNSDFPTRTTLGADYKLNDTASLFVAEEFTQGESQDSETTRIGLKASPWSGGQVGSSVEQQYDESGVRVFSVMGLKQTWKVSKKWSLDAGLDRTETLKHPGTSTSTSSGTDFTAVSLGAGFTEEKWSWTGRLESRTSEDEDKLGVFTGAYGEVRDGFGLAGALQAFRTETSAGEKETTGDLRLSLAYRPKDSKWIVLDRLDYLFDEQKGSGLDYDNWRIVNNMNANYKPNKKTQISLQYGAKYVNETIDDTDYSGYTDLMGLEGRYDVTRKWDMGLRGQMLHSWDAGQYKYGCGPSIGYNLVKNAWVSAGYNLLGFKDRDFSKADFTAQGPYVKVRMKFDQKSVKEAVKWFSGQ